MRDRLLAASAWENEGGALGPPPTGQADVPDNPCGSLTTLTAIAAVWPDLSLEVRRRIASDAIVAISPAKPRR